MGRLDTKLLERIEVFSDRCVAVAEQLESQGKSARVVSQIIGAGTAVGANSYEADEALSRKDFCKCIAIAVKEINETRFWFNLLRRREWMTGEQLGHLQDEAAQLKKILGAILSRTRSSASAQIEAPSR